MITGFVTGQSLRLHHGVVASDTIDYLEAEFLFRTDDWRDASEIKAVFTRDDGTGEYAIPLTEGKIRKEDHLNLSKGLWKVHLVGCTYSGGKLVQRITTVPDFLRVEKAGAVDGEPLPEVPATDVERLEAEIEQIRRGGGTVKVSATRPETDDVGGLWFDTSTGKLRVCTSLTLPGMAGYPPVPNYTDAGAVSVSEAAPSDAVAGNVWYKPSSGVLYICVGRDVTVMPPSGVPIWASAGGKTEIIDGGETVTVKFGG